MRKITFFLILGGRKKSVNGLFVFSADMDAGRGGYIN